MIPSKRYDVESTTPAVPAVPAVPAAGPPSTAAGVRGRRTSVPTPNALALGGQAAAAAVVVPLEDAVSSWGQRRPPVFAFGWGGEPAHPPSSFSPGGAAAAVVPVSAVAAGGQVRWPPLSAAAPPSSFSPGVMRAAVVPVSAVAAGVRVQGPPLSAVGPSSPFRPGGAVAADVQLSAGELKEDPETKLLNDCFDVQQQIYMIKEFMGQFYTAIEREDKQNDQTKVNTDGDVGTSTVLDCITQAISMMSEPHGEIIELHELVSKMPSITKKPPLNNLIVRARSLFTTLLSKSDSRRFLRDCVDGVTSLTAILDYACDTCDDFLAKQKREQLDKTRKEKQESKHEQDHAAGLLAIHTNVSDPGQDGLPNAKTLLADFVASRCSDDDTEWTSTSTSSSSLSSRLSCDTEISVAEVLELYDDARMFIQITGDLQALSAALLLKDDLPTDEELKYKNHLLDRAVSCLTKFNNQSRKDTSEIADKATHFLREQPQKTKKKGNGLQLSDDDSDDDWGGSSSSAASSVSGTSNGTKDELRLEAANLQRDRLIPGGRIVLNLQRLKALEEDRKKQLSKVFKQIKAPDFSQTVRQGFVGILQQLVSQGIVRDDGGNEIKPLKLIERDGSKTAGLSEHFMYAKAQKATTFNVNLGWLREYVLRLMVDGMHDAQRATSSGASSGDEEEVSCFFKIFSDLNKKCAENMATRISEDGVERGQFTGSPFFQILQHPQAQFETQALQAMEERVIILSQSKEPSKSKPSIAVIPDLRAAVEGERKLCIDNASTMRLDTINAERLGMFSTLLDGGASNECVHWIFGPRNCRYHAEANGTSLTLHMCEIVTFKNGVYCINICIEIRERRAGAGSQEHRYRTIHTLPLCDGTGEFKETFTPIELNKVCVLWNGIIDDVANGVMQHNALKILGPNVLKAFGDESQLWDTLISVFLKNGGLLPYYLHITGDVQHWHMYNTFVTSFNERILGQPHIVPSSSDGEQGLIQMFKTVAKQIAGDEGMRYIEFIYEQCKKIILASNDRLNHAGTAHFYLGTRGCQVFLGHLRHTTKYENPHWKSLLACCGGRVLAADANSPTGIVIRACVPALSAGPIRQTMGDVHGPGYESSVASHSSSIFSRGESVNLGLVKHFHLAYAREHAIRIANRNTSSPLQPITETEDVLIKVHELLPNPVFSALEIHNDVRSVGGMNASQDLGSDNGSDNGYQRTPSHVPSFVGMGGSDDGGDGGDGGVNSSQDLGSQIIPGFLDVREPVRDDERPDPVQKKTGETSGGSTKQAKNKSMKRKRSNSKKFPTKKKRQSKKKNTIKKGNNNVNIKHKNKTKKIKKLI